MIISANEVKDYVGSISLLSALDPFACRIISLYNSYKPELAFVDYWLTCDENSGKATGAIARNGSNFILFLTEKCNLDEVSSFMRVAGASGIICSGEYELELSGHKSVTGSVLVKSTSFENIGDNFNIVKPDIKSAYDLIISCADENFTAPAFDDFYVDVNHKLRHSAMRMYGIEKNGALVSVAMTIAESTNSAVLGAVACSSEYRKQGYGSAIVKYITNRLITENKSVFLHRGKDANVSFYNNLGFSECGTWREYYF